MPKPFIATEPINIGGFLGYNPGDEVPEQVVADHNLHAVTSREGTKSAEKAKDGG